MYYKLGQACVTNLGTFVLLQIRKNVVTNWGSFIITIRASIVTNRGSYYKLGQPLLQNRAAITNWGKMYHKLEQVLQIRAFITNWGMTNTYPLSFVDILYIKCRFCETFTVINFVTRILLIETLYSFKTFKC